MAMHGLDAPLSELTPDLDPRAGRRLRARARRRRQAEAAGRWSLQNSVTARVIHAWFDMRRSVMWQIGRAPSEARLLAMLMGSNLAFFLSWTMKAVIVPNEAGVALFSLEIGALALIALFGRTAAMYLMAMVLGAVCRIFGGTGSWRDTRIAVFWGAFVTAPFGVAAALFSVLFTNLEVYYPIFGAPWIAMPPYWIGLLPFVWYIAKAVARVHGFRRTSPLFLGMTLATLVAVLGGMYFHARGLI